jgi:hypothetical protein
MDTQEYKCRYFDKSFTLYTALFKSYLHCVCITIFDDDDKDDKLQYFVYPDFKKVIASFIPTSTSLQIIEVLYSFLNYNQYPLPDFKLNYIPSLKFQKNKSQVFKNTILFSTNLHTFYISINDEPDYYFVKIGGKEFIGCMEIFINKPSSRYYNNPKIAQIYSEPECWYQLGKKGDTINLIKGSLQLCQMIFGVNLFCLNDNSNIECGVTNMNKTPPRKLSKPLSLAHLYIATYGKTWYEYNLNAFLKNENIRQEYYNSLQNLQNPEKKQKNDFETFAAINYFDKEQYNYLKPFYEKSNTWQEFFQSIPKEQRCRMLNRWLADYLDSKILKFKPTIHEWCVFLGNLGISNEEINMDIQDMIRVDLFVNMTDEFITYRGGKPNYKNKTLKKIHKSQFTRKQKTKPLSFSNNYYGM